MSIHIFNIPGIVIAGIAFGVAFGVGRWMGTTAEGPLMIVAGPLCAVMDAAYRYRRPEGRWFSPGVGGAMFLIPLWILGILWFVLGIVYTLQGGA